MTAEKNTTPTSRADLMRQLRSWLLHGKIMLLDRLLGRRDHAHDVLDEGFLPNFCKGENLFNVAIIAEMLALVITLVSPQLPIANSMLGNFFLISIFIQWIAISSAGILCLTRKQLNRLSNERAAVMSYLILLCMTWVISEAAIWVLWLVGMISTPSPEWNAYFHVQNITVAAIVNALALRYFLARHHLKQRTLSEAQARIQALRSRIRPHFLFNTMNIIASLIRSSPTQAETAIENMADLFRTMLADQENLVPIKSEIAIAQKYLDIEALRLDSRLKVEWDIGKFQRKTVIPVLTLQPILESAIQHGIEPLAEGGRIMVRMREENDAMHIENPAPAPRPRGRAPHKGTDLALDNVRQRLESHYGELAKLNIMEEPGQFMVSLILPIRGENQ